MAHSPSGSRAAAPSTGDEAFTDAGAEDFADSKLSALLFGTISSPPKTLSPWSSCSLLRFARRDPHPHFCLVHRDAGFVCCSARHDFGTQIGGCWCGFFKFVLPLTNVCCWGAGIDSPVSSRCLILHTSMSFA
jgi:hypothetical protein